jgi:hypothetical protein
MADLSNPPSRSVQNIDFRRRLGLSSIEGKKKHIAFALVIPFRMKVHHELAQSTAKRCFAEQD